MHVLVAASSGELFSGEAESLSLPSEVGVLTILPHHQALVSLLSVGELNVVHGKEHSTFHIAGGVLEVNVEGDVNVLAEL